MTVKTTRWDATRTTRATAAAALALATCALTLSDSKLSEAGPHGTASAAGDVELSIVRLAGDQAPGTAVAASTRFYSPGVTAVIVLGTHADRFALAAGPAAVRIGGPVLYTSRIALPSATSRELERLRPQRIYAVGDTNSISSVVLAQLDDLSAGGATRLRGLNRYQTAARLAARFFPSASTVFVAGAERYHEALAGGPAAAEKNAPMLLVSPTDVPDATREQLARLDPDRIFVLGSTKEVPASVAVDLTQYAPVERVAGTDITTTAVAISKRFFGTDRPAAFLATSDWFKDATVAIPPAGRSRGPLLWVRGPTIRAETRRELVRLRPHTVYATGRTDAVGFPVVRVVQRLLGVCWSGSKPPAGDQQVITSVPGATRRIALTFDMGGRLVPAQDIVAFLAANQVCTTYFPTGIMATTDEALPVMASIAARPELFEVGNHTLHHCDLVNGGGGSPLSWPCDVPMTEEFIRNELTTGGNQITILTGMAVKPMWRPPYSSFNAFVLDNAAAVGYTKTIQFNRDTIDWRESTTASQIVDRVIDPLPPDGTIVLLHLGGYHTLEALPWIVTYLRDRGYTFTSVSDMLDE